MKCPFRITNKIKWESGAASGEPEMVQEFAECYGAECPYYRPESHFGSVKIPEHCGRVINEKTKSGKEI